MSDQVHETSAALPRLAVIGTGYLGAVHAACMADFGFEVIGVDIDQEAIDQLSAGIPPFFEPGLGDVLARSLASGRLTFSNDLRAAVDVADIFFICVGTPQMAGSNAADVSYVNAAVEGLAGLLTRDALIVGKSTVPVGTASRLADVAAKLAKPGINVEVAWNPEFLREGHAVADTKRPDRIVVGVTSDAADSALRGVYAAPLAEGVPYLPTDLATAELVKVAANSFLATKISFINAMAEVCDKVGADVSLLAEALGYDSRIGNEFLRAGIGFGGGCLPKDLRAFMARAGELGVDDTLSFLREIDEINLRQRERAAEAATSMLDGAVAGRRVGILGAAFKPNSDDVRDSPALHIAANLHVQGADVRVFDPHANANAAAAYPTLNYTESALAACEGAELVLLLTEWAEFLAIDPNDLAAVVKTRRIFDARNTLDANQWRAAGWEFRGLGRP
jgi:UDPglucose 6-dehydrogenase